MCTNPFLTPPFPPFVQSFNEQEAVVSKIITELSEYMNDHRCTHAVMNEVSGYYRNLFKHKTLFDEQKILPRLHCTLRTKILIAQNEDVISGTFDRFSPALPRLFPPCVIAALVPLTQINTLIYSHRIVCSLITNTRSLHNT